MGGKARGVRAAPCTKNVGCYGNTALSIPVLGYLCSGEEGRASSHVPAPQNLLLFPPQREHRGPEEATDASLLPAEFFRGSRDVLGSKSSAQDGICCSGGAPRAETSVLEDPQPEVAGLQLEYRCWWDPSWIFSPLAQLLALSGRRCHPQDGSGWFWMVLDGLTLISHPVGPCGSIPTPGGRGHTHPPGTGAQTAQTPQKMLPECCDHRDDRSRLVPSPAPRGDREGQHIGDRATSRTQEHPSLPLPPHTGMRGTLQAAPTPPSTPKPIPVPFQHQRDSAVGLSPARICPPCSFWANPCPQRCR